MSEEAKKTAPAQEAEQPETAPEEKAQQAAPEQEEKTPEHIMDKPKRKMNRSL